jgi:hypothetical protein
MVAGYSLSAAEIIRYFARHPLGIREDAIHVPYSRKSVTESRLGVSPFNTEARRASSKALQPIPGQTIAWGKLGGGIRPDGAGLLKHHHVVFYLAFTQVQSVCDLIEDRSLVPVARLPENAKDFRIRLLYHIPARLPPHGLVLRTNLARPLQTRCEDLARRPLEV